MNRKEVVTAFADAVHELVTTDEGLMNSVETLVGITDDTEDIDVLDRELRSIQIEALREVLQRFTRA